MGSDRWLRWIAGFKLVKATLLLATAVGAFELLNPTEASRMNRFAMVLAADRHGRVFGALVHSLAAIDPRMLRLLGFGSLLYGLLFYVEGFGLYAHQRWAEYLTIVSTGGLIPFELFELHRHASPTKILVLVANLAILVYLARRVMAKNA